MRKDIRAAHKDLDHADRNKMDMNPVRSADNGLGIARRRPSGLVTGLAIVAVLLAVGISLLIPSVSGELDAAGVSPWVVQAGLVAVTVAFSVYTFQRERQVKRLIEALQDEQAEAAKMTARIDFLAEVQTDRDSVNALLVASADGIVFVDQDRRVNRTNPALDELSGWNASDVTGHTCEETFGCRQPSGELACGECPFTRTLTSGESIKDHSFEIQVREGGTRWISGAYSPVRDGSGQITGALGSLRDVTEAKAVEQLQNDFVSIVSHELRGPLTAIKGFVKTLILKSDALPKDTQREFLQTINDQADRLNQLVEDLLNVSRIQSKRLKINTIQTDPEELVRKLINQFSSKWVDREIVVEADPNLPPLLADENKLEEVFINLIDNAVKYSPSGGSVRVSIWPTETTVDISVEDSGIGMAPDDMASLFEKFHRIATPETRDIGGTGLGLYIVKSLVEAHGGQIFVTSAPGVGSTFTASFPRRETREVIRR